MTTTQQIRAFNRFYTNFLGLIDKQFLGGPLSLSECRILFELGQYTSLPATQLVNNLHIDKGYLSRILKKFEKNNWIQKETAAQDKRMQLLRLSPAGKELLGYLGKQSDQYINTHTNHLSPTEKAQLVEMFQKIQNKLDKRTQNAQKVTLEDIDIRNDLQMGDMSFVIAGHAELYKKEFDYGVDFEYYVIKSMAEYFENRQDDRERVWICEHQGKRIGFLLLMNRGDAAQLRFFFIDQSYRGIGLGKKLMELFIAFLKEKEYKSCYLWTTTEQLTAAELYIRHGFKKVLEVANDTVFGRPTIEYKYELKL